MRLRARALRSVFMRQKAMCEASFDGNVDELPADAAAVVLPAAAGISRTECACFNQIACARILRRNRMRFRLTGIALAQPAISV